VKGCFITIQLTSGQKPTEILTVLEWTSQSRDTFGRGLMFWPQNSWSVHIHINL